MDGGRRVTDGRSDCTHVDFTLAQRATSALTPNHRHSSSHHSLNPTRIPAAVAMRCGRAMTMRQLEGEVDGSAAGLRTPTALRVDRRRTGCDDGVCICVLLGGVDAYGGASGDGWAGCGCVWTAVEGQWKSGRTADGAVTASPSFSLHPLHVMSMVDDR